MIMKSCICNTAHTSQSHIQSLPATTSTAAGAMMSATTIAIIAATTIIAHENKSSKITKYENVHIHLLTQ